MANLFFNTYRNVFRYDPTLAGEVAANADYPIIPSYASSGRPNLLMDTVQFGDGYKQISESGIRPVQQAYTLTFNNRNKKVIRALVRFFDGEPGSIYDRLPSEFFFFKVPYPWDAEDSQPRRFTLKSAPSIQPVQFNAWSLSIEIEEWFGI